MTKLGNISDLGWEVIPPSQEELDKCYENSFYKMESPNICIFCKSKFKFGQKTKKHSCGLCKIIRKCSYCGKNFETTSNNHDLNRNFNYLEFIQENKSIIGKVEHFCSRNCILQYRNRSEKMIKSVIEMNKSRVEKNLSKTQICKKCNKQFNSIFTMEICNACITAKTNTNNYLKEQKCIKCGKIFHSTFIMKIGPCCNPNVVGFSNFITKNNVKYYKNELVTEIIQKLNSGEYDVKDFSGFNKRFGEWYYNQENILTGEITKLNGSLFEIKDRVEYYYDKSVNDYIPWEKYKQKFSLQNVDFELPENFEWYTTFRKQNSLDWSNARLAFERNLVENNINWFVYIKFYYNEYNQIKPLVIGKSGSLNVNAVGSDVSFSTDINDGTARKFLCEKGLDWCKTQIAIYKVNSEAEALRIEKEIVNKYNLFQS